MKGADVKLAFLMMAACAVGLSSAWGDGLTDDFVRQARVAYASGCMTNSLLDVAPFDVRDGSRHDCPPNGLVRWVSVDCGANVRDIGGWTGLRAGRVYRGSELNCHTNPAQFASWQKTSHGLYLTDSGRRTMSEELGVRTDLDLRSDREIPTPGRSPIPGARHVHVACDGYVKYLADTNKAARIFRVFADSGNYPIYFHCHGGADRTGTVAFLIEGLCGVSEADLAADFELTSFSRFGKRRCYDYDEGARHPRYGSLVTAVKSRPGATLSEKIEDYAIRACGLRPEEVAAIRRCLVKGERRK